MVLEILDFTRYVLSFIPLPEGVSLFIIFIVFLILTYKIFKMILHVAGAGFVGGLFPIVANYLFGIPIPLSFESVATYAIAAMALMWVYLFVKGVHSLIKYATWPFRHKKKKST